MKSTLLITLMGVTIGTLSAVNASAQVPTRLVMTVPFDFQIHEKDNAGGRILPADGQSHPVRHQ